MLEHMKAIKYKKPKLGYLFIYKAEPTEKEVEFHRLQQIKLIPTLSIYSGINNRHKIEEILKERNTWSDKTEIKYLNYKFVSVEPLNEILTKIRRESYWLVEIHEDKTYTCFTTYNRLKYLRTLYSVQALAFTDKLSKKDYLLKDAKDYNSLINKGRVIVTKPFLRDKCLKLRMSKGHKTEFIYNTELIPKFKTSNKQKRISNYKGKVDFQHDPELQRLVCITDGITVSRIKKYKADKLIKEFSKMRFCEKWEWQKYINGLRSNKIIKLSTQGSKDGKDLRTRIDRRVIKQKRKLFGKRLQFIPGKWIEDPTNTEYEILDKSYAKTIVVKKHLPTYKTRLPHNAQAKYRKDRLMKEYRKVFNDVERRGKFSPVEKWSTQFMIILNMVKMNKSERDIALYIADIFTGWNDKKIKRFITYLKLTKHGLNYQPNKKTTSIKRTNVVEEEVPGIQISKLPYGQLMAIEYTSKNEDGTEKIIREQNVRVQQKRIIKDDLETKEKIVICPISAIEKWVIQKDFVDTDKCKWNPMVSIVPYKKISVKRIEYHLPKRKLKTKKWKHPIKGTPYDQLPF